MKWIIKNDEPDEILYETNDEFEIIIMKLMHNDKNIEDCACKYALPKWHERCVFCNKLGLCLEDKDGIDRGSYACSFVRYHGYLPHDIAFPGDTEKQR